jgi:DNA-binding SARP family transcriptional activator
MDRQQLSAQAEDGRQLKELLFTEDETFYSVLGEMRRLFLQNKIETLRKYSLNTVRI